ncbi:MAG: tRNA preQ1(34) S-adenosylmethionine ribosyltransferase-isomerase QueA [Alphaproteobacteria bacterium]|nr:tRNA preQ1(34) S-adenosylmethionine ribosyltransferase-isomerase QueA [Alphaproteobacteria bacterium]
MKVDIFDFDLPRELIASAPVSPRHASRLLDLSVEDKITDRHFCDLPDILRAGDLLVCNDTKVIPARLYAARGEALVEVTLYHPEEGGRWWSFIKNSKRLRLNDIIRFYNDDVSADASPFTARVCAKDEEDGVLLEFLCEADCLPQYLQQFGYMPLPPYIKRDRPGKDSLWHKFNDRENYQTVYASHSGAVAAPTAGLHFTDEVMARLAEKGVQQLFITLHVGAGTFLPVKTDDTDSHKMHAEFGQISAEAAAAVNEAKRQGRRIIAVGTTSLRLLESAADEQGMVHPFCGETDIFITPGYRFKAIDMLITNFHLPKSTLFMLVSAVAGLERMREAYAHAIAEKYRFYSYGDSSIIKCVNKI